MKITLINPTPCAITELFDNVAGEMGYYSAKNQYDCRHINIAPNLQDNFYAYYTTLATAEGISESDARVGTTMLLAMCGPKVDESLKANEVEVFDGFIC